MSNLERIYNPLPRPKPWRRGVASTLDFILTWLLSLVAINPQGTVQWGQLLLFMLGWLGLRVIVVAQNKGQSPGHWAMDMKVVDERNRVPGLLELVKRESIVGGEALLAIVALSNLQLGLVIFLLLLPLVIDSSLAWTDSERQTLHDRLSRTQVVHTYRGFSLDRKLVRFLAKQRQRMR
uniref:RDD domain containing protein n=1 Tax=Cyanothece sp. (strain PCC 7425 / ATCC 29141) TaxID=395961 RepID=B8HWY7_CYAP4